MSTEVKIYLDDADEEKIYDFMKRYNDENHSVRMGKINFDLAVTILFRVGFIKMKDFYSNLYDEKEGV